jgi:hypothetical protein
VANDDRRTFKIAQLLRQYSDATGRKARLLAEVKEFAATGRLECRQKNATLKSVEDVREARSSSR